MIISISSNKGVSISNVEHETHPYVDYLKTFYGF